MPGPLHALSARFLGLVLGGLAGLTGAETVAVGIANLQDLPVHAHAVALDLELLAKPLGAGPDTPLAITDRDGRREWPVLRTEQDGRPVLLVLVSLAPRSRIDLVARRASRWPDPGQILQAQASPGAGTGTLANGVVRFTLGGNGWDLGFDPQTAGPAAAVALTEGAGKPARAKGGAPLGLIHQAGLKCWIDDRNRGRITGRPEPLGLVPFPGQATVVSCTASIAEGGVPTLTLVRRMTGMADAVQVRETFALPPGQPVLTHRIRWENQGKADRWIAYVGSGDGTVGTWGGTLMADPLVERFKFPTRGYLNGAETRPAWNGPLARVSMESESTGCGVGLSTLLPTPGSVGQGSMIWGINRNGFQVNLIDPDVGQFPFPLPAGSGRDNGNAYLLTQTGTSTYRQVVALWESFNPAGKNPSKTPRLHSPCLVTVGDQVVAVQTVDTTGDIRSLVHEQGGDLVAGVRVDYNRHYLCTGTVAPGQGPVEAVFLALEPKAKEVSLGTATTGEFTFDLNAAAGRADEIPGIITFRRGAKAITRLAIGETMTAAPEPWSPLEGATFPRVATMFRWKPIPLVTDYQLQWADNPEFTGATEITVAMSLETPWYLPPQEKLPGPGQWCWRIRGRTGPVIGPWSPVRRFTITDELTKKPLVRPVSTADPLFTLEASRWRSFAGFTSDIPTDLRPRVAIVIEGFIGQKDASTIDQALAGVEQLGHPFLLRTHPPTQISLADIAWTCQHYPNFIGIQGGETVKKIYEAVRVPADKGGTGDADYHRRMVQILAHYGRFYHEADGTYKDDAWQDLWDQQGALLKEYGGYIILSQKNNIIRRQFYTQSAVMGLWLGGITLGHGAWEDGGFYWQNAGFDGIGVCKGERSGKLSTMPRIWWTLMFVQGLARGCCIYSLDGQTLQYGVKEASRQPNGPWASALWNDAWQTTDTFKRFVVPLIRATGEHHLVPSREALLQDLKLAVYNDRKTPGDPVAWPHYLEYGPLYASTYGFRTMGGIHGQLWEIFPNTGRYGIIPVLPQGNAPLASGVRNLPLSGLQDPAQVTAVFDGAYPAWYEGNAFASRHGDLFTVMNSQENQDESQTFAIPVTSPLVTRLAGTVQVHAYVLGKMEDQGRSFWLQANGEYQDRDTVLTLTCSRQPTVTGQPAASVASTWDATSRTLSLRLKHAAGAVEVHLN